MNSYWLLYFIEQADNFIALLSIILIIVSILFIVFLIVASIARDEKEKELAKKHLKKITPILAVLILSVTLLPSTKSCYRIIGLGTVIEYSKTNEKVKELPENFIKAVNNYLEKVKVNELLLYVNVVLAIIWWQLVNKENLKIIKKSEDE